MIRALRRLALVGAALAVPSSASAQEFNCGFNMACDAYAKWQGGQRDGLVQHAMINTYCAFQIRTNSDGCVGTAANDFYVTFNAMVHTMTANGGLSPTVNAAEFTFQQFLRSLGLPEPYQLGGFGGDGGGWGGGGAGGGGWCENLNMERDVQGNMIIPSYRLDMGDPIPLGSWFASQNNSHAGALGTKTIGHSWASRARRVVHLLNMTRWESIWFGVVGPMADGSIQFATVPYRLPNGNIEVRQTAGTLGTGGLDGPHSDGALYNYDQAHPYHHRPCPEVPVPGAHYYGYTSSSGNHLHYCVAFMPQDSFGWEGYAINSKTTIPWPTKGWPTNSTTPLHLRDCPLSPALLAKMTDKVLEKISQQPGGRPKTGTVETVDARPGDTRVGDLGDNPTTGNQPAAPNDTVNIPPQTGGSGPQPNQTINVTVDLGPNPNTPEPTLGEVPSNIMDPIFDWLPDLPSLTIPSINSECPVWNVDLRDYGGSNWQWIMNSHCDIAEQNRSAIGALMLAIWGIAAALVILRA